MLDPTTRALRLLLLLQARRLWSGSELSKELGVTPRTVRRDVERLRELGYEISSLPGTDGGYQLKPGERLPPLLLDDDEAVTIAVGLRMAAVALGEKTTLSALVKLEQLLASHLRRRVSALQEYAIPTVGPGVPVEAEIVAELALICRDQVRTRFHYVSAEGVHSTRHVEPHTLVAHSTRWYVICWDLDRKDWRTFRLDRLSQLSRTGVRFTPHELPAQDLADWVTATDTNSSYRYEAVVHLDMPLEEAQHTFGVWASGAVENGAGGTDWPVGGDYLADLVYGLAWIPPEVTWTITANDETQEILNDFGARLNSNSFNNRTAVSD